MYIKLITLDFLSSNKSSSGAKLEYY